MERFINESGLKFDDISSEQTRVYHFSDGSTLTIENPLKLNVSKSGGHRLFDANNKCYYVAPKWNYIDWLVKEGQPNFVK